MDKFVIKKKLVPNVSTKSKIRKLRRKINPTASKKKTEHQEIKKDEVQKTSKKKFDTNQAKRKTVVKSSPFSRYFDLMERSKAAQIDFPEDRGFIDRIVEIYEKQCFSEDLTKNDAESFSCKELALVPFEEKVDVVKKLEERIPCSFESKDYEELSLIEKEMYDLNEYIKEIAPEVEALLVKINYDNFLEEMTATRKFKKPLTADAATFVSMRSLDEKRKKKRFISSHEPSIYTLQVYQSDNENEMKKIIVNVIKETPPPPKIEIAPRVRKPFWPRNISMKVKEESGKVSLAIQTLTQEEKRRTIMQNYCPISGRRIHKIRQIKLRHNRVTSSEESDSVIRLTNKRIQTPKNVKVAVMKSKQKKKSLKIAERERRRVKVVTAEKLESSSDECEVSPKDVFSKSPRRKVSSIFPRLDDKDESGIKKYLIKVVGHDDPWDSILVSKSVLPKVKKLIRRKVKEQLDFGVNPKSIFRKLFGTDYCEINPNLRPIFTNNITKTAKEEEPDFLNNSTKISQLFIKNLIRKHSPDPDNNLKEKKTMLITRILTLAERFAKPESKESLDRKNQSNLNEEIPGYSIDELMKFEGDIERENVVNYFTTRTIPPIGEMVDETMDTIIDKYEMKLDLYAIARENKKESTSRPMTVKKTKRIIQNSKPPNVKRYCKVIGSIAPPATPGLEGIQLPKPQCKVTEKAKFNYRRPQDRRTEEFRKKFIRYTALLNTREERLRRKKEINPLYEFGRFPKTKRFKHEQKPQKSIKEIKQPIENREFSQKSIKLKPKVKSKQGKELPASEFDLRVDATVNTSTTRLLEIWKRKFTGSSSDSNMKGLLNRKPSGVVRFNQKASVEKLIKVTPVPSKTHEAQKKVKTQPNRTTPSAYQTKKMSDSKIALGKPNVKKPEEKLIPKEIPLLKQSDSLKYKNASMPKNLSQNQPISLTKPTTFLAKIPTEQPKKIIPKLSSTTVQTEPAKNQDKINKSKFAKTTVFRHSMSFGNTPAIPGILKKKSKYKSNERLKKVNKSVISSSERKQQASRPAPKVKWKEDILKYTIDSSSTPQVKVSVVKMADEPSRKRVLRRRTKMIPPKKVISKTKLVHPRTTVTDSKEARKPVVKSTNTDYQKNTIGTKEKQRTTKKEIEEEIKPKLAILSSMYLPTADRTIEPQISKRRARDVHKRISQHSISSGGRRKISVTSLDIDDDNPVDAVDSLVLIRNKLQKNFKSARSLSPDSQLSFKNSSDDSELNDYLQQMSDEKEFGKASVRKKKKYFKDQGTDPMVDSSIKPTFLARRGFIKGEKPSIENIITVDTKNKLKSELEKIRSSSLSLNAIQAAKSSVLDKEKDVLKVVNEVVRYNDNYDSILARIRQKLLEYIDLDESLDHTRYIWNYYQEKSKFQCLQRMVEINDEVEQLMRKAGYVTVPISRVLNTETQLGSISEMLRAQSDKQRDADSGSLTEEVTPSDQNESVVIQVVQKDFGSPKSKPKRRNIFKKPNLKNLFKSKKKSNESRNKMQEKGSLQKLQGKEDLKKLIEMQDKLNKRINNVTMKNSSSWRP